MPRPRRALEALSTLTSAGITRTIKFAIAQNTLACALRAQGNYREAKSTAERALATAKETIDPRQPLYAMLLTTLALILQETGDLHRAEKLCREAVDIYLHATEKDLITIGQAHHNLARVYALQGKTKPALNEINLALAAWNQALPSDHPFIVYALSTKIVVCLKMKASTSRSDHSPSTRIGFISFRPGSS
jgi:tetratricopeptide (TPR) repeat protein